MDGAGGCPELQALLDAEGGALALTAAGRVRCEHTRHEMPALAAAVRAHVSSARYGKAKEVAAAMAQFAPHIVPSADDPKKMMCKLTGKLLPRKEEVVWAHMMGKKFVKALEMVEAKKVKKEATEEENGAGGGAAQQEQAPTAEGAVDKSESRGQRSRRVKREGKAAALKEMKAAQERAATFRKRREEKVGHLDGDGPAEDADGAQDSDGEAPCFWFPPGYEDDFMDDGRTYVMRGDSDCSEDSASDAELDECADGESAEDDAPAPPKSRGKGKETAEGKEKGKARTSMGAAGGVSKKQRKTKKAGTKGGRP